MKKRSVASSVSLQPPDGPTFFLDRQLGRYKMAGVLRAAGLKLEIHDDHFAQNAPDPEWLVAAGRNGWIVITRDERIRYREAEKQAIRRAKVRAFVLAARGDLKIETLAETFLNALPKIKQHDNESETTVHRQDFPRWKCADNRILIAAPTASPERFHGN